MNTPGAKEFALNSADYGIPTREELRGLRIWDIHYHGLWEGNLRKDPLGKLLTVEKKKELRKFLEANSHRVCGLVPIDPSDPVGSCQKIDEWVDNRPCVGIKYYGGNPGRRPGACEAQLACVERCACSF